jgi:hypothetical protein
MTSAPDTEADDPAGPASVRSDSGVVCRFEALGSEVGGYTGR